MHNAGIAAEGAPVEVLTAALIGDVYRQKVCIITHSRRGCPVVLTI